MPCLLRCSAFVSDKRLTPTPSPPKKTKKTKNPSSQQFYILRAYLLSIYKSPMLESEVVKIFLESLPEEERGFAEIGKWSDFSTSRVVWIWVGVVLYLNLGVWVSIG